MRKPQPFTIGTRLSIPKCPDLSTSSPGMDARSERVSRYPSPQRGSGLSHSPEDPLCPGSLVRSIKKITLSLQAEGAAPREGTGTLSPRLLARASYGNCNNNNSRSLRHMVPGAADLPCDWSVRDPRMAECHKTAKCPGDACDSALGDSVRIVPSTGICDIRTGRASREPPDTEKLNQKIEQVDDPVSRTPSAASVHPQLQTLRDQWHLLKQAAANQGCAVGGATTVLEFNKKADELEMWMREKEEIPPLHVLLDQNLDKVHITRKILDLKQEQIHYCGLEENVSRLSQKLEKQGRPESRAASARRRHLNRMWLRLQSALQEHHQSLQLALEAASLWHQADTIERAIQEKSRCAELRSRDQDLRDIAGQVMMFDVSVSQVSDLHPLLSSRARHRQRQVKERWARLRTEKASSSAASTDPTRDTRDHVTCGSVGRGRAVHQVSGGRAENSAPQRWPGSQVIDQRPTKRSGTCETQANHNLQNGHQLQRPPETPKDRHLLRELASTSQWLQGVELLLSEPAAMRSPELIRKDLKQVSLLERELRSRSSALQRLRRKNRTSQKAEWSVTEEVKVQEVEERFQTLQDALQRRVSDLRDTLVLSEFMKVVQMEEERKKKETVQETWRGVVRSDPDVLAVDRTETFTPLEELQEAVEMLNDAVKERERALAATREDAELESRVSGLSQTMAAACSKLHDIWSQLEAAEKEMMAVKGEMELPDLQGVISQQQQVEAEMSDIIDLEVRRLQERAEQLEGECPAWRLSAGRKIEEAMRTRTDLQTLVQKNQARLQRTKRLREFFLLYLRMISWSEVTRDQILSESPRGCLTPAQRDLERTVEGKLREFEVLAGIGWQLIGEDHLLAQTIRERLEEVQGLLSWLLAWWRCQKQKTKEAAASVDARTDMALISSSSVALEEFECPEDEDMTPLPAPRGPILRKYRRRALSPIQYQPPSCRSPDMDEGVDMPEDSPRKCTRGPLWLEPKNLPTGSDSPEPQEEAVMVSTYLKTKEEGQGTYHSLTVPRRSKVALSTGHGHESTFPSCEASTSALPKIRSNGFFKSLRRKEKAQRCTIQGIMGLYSDRKHDTKDASRYQTSTWPPKQEKTFPTAETNMELETFLNYVKNPLSKDIDAECGSSSKKLRSPDSGQQTMRNSCPHLTVGSVLTLQISKEPHILDNTKDAITVISAVDSGNDEHLHSKEKLKHEAGEMLTEEHSSITRRDPQWLGTRAWLEALTTSPGYCRQNIHGYGKSIASSQESQELEALIDTFELDRLSPLVLRHLNYNWNTPEEALNSPKSLEDVSPNCDAPFLQEKERVTSLSPVLQETRGATTSFSVPQETEGAIALSLTIQETGGATTPFSVLKETEGVTALPSTLQETGDATTSFSFLQDIERATSFSPALQETGGATTSFSVLHETEGATISPVPQKTEGATATSPVYQKTGRAHYLKKYSDNGQSASMSSSDYVLHTYEPSNHSSYSTIESPPDVRIFTKTNSLTDVLHPDHDFLENDDEELEGIWNNAKKVPPVCPPPVSHNMAPKVMVGGSPAVVKHNSHKELYGQVVIGAEPNMLVATFTLPDSARLSTAIVGQKRPNTWKKNSPSTVSTPTNCNAEEICKGSSRPSPQTSKPETVENTSMMKVTRKLDFHLMEGPLEKKHVLQVGGRKASSRAWGMFYAVLVRRTLCFYHDHRHSSKSSASAPPLHLTGAVCTVESDYTKRDNCFRLRLIDGSEYLFRAPTPESLQQWVTKLRHNSGMEDSDLLRKAVMTSELAGCPRVLSRSLMPDLHKSIPAQAADMVPVYDLPSWKETENVATAAKVKSHHRHLPGSFPLCDEDGDPDNNPTSRRRSQSFSSVMYRKVTPVSSSQEPSSGYSVTLYIDDPLLPRGRCHSFAAPQGAFLSRHMADPKLRNKSVFRKFFRKKE
ncbi:spectrin alpha chain, non-erythrocytic 1-like isoform X2 [Bufo bufo]|uniref:spectrin alpha chain, non-erythrocytic 1-like isoform X2 n=1 Tax=Bufo bufo TaxID=8384 RepID=UPI001ABE54E0|nr:spectrin alpha chain, non-erythrocytic 1-like isoform X2 [Bufo bufo]